MDDRELDNFLVSRGASAECPVCGHDQWALIGLEPGSTLIVPGMDATERQFIGVRVLGRSCLNCGFLRLHTKDVMTDNLEYLPGEGDGPPGSEDESAE